MRSRYQRWFWPVVLLDVVMIIIILVTGPNAYHKISGKVAEYASLSPTLTPTVYVEPLNMEILLPEMILEQRDFPLTIKVRNNSEKTITLDELILPKAFVDNMVFKNSEPLFAQKNITDIGEGYPLGFQLSPQEERTFIFIFQAKKMQAFNEKVLLRSSLGTQEETLMVAIAPDAQTKPYVDSAYPFRAVVKITAMYYDDTNTLQPAWSGIGSIVASDGLILTNAHTVLSNQSHPVDSLMISLIDSEDNPPRDSYFAEVIQADYYLDLAVIQIVTDLQGNMINKDSLRLPSVEFGDPTRLTLGKRLYVLGLPAISRELVTQISGDISGFTYQNPYGEKAFIQLSSLIPANFSGGMALDEHGKMLAIAVMNVSPKGVVGISECQYLADSNGDRAINDNDLCMPSSGALGGFRSVEFAIPLINAAKAGESKIYRYEDELIRISNGNKVQLEENFLDHDSGWLNSSSKDKAGAYNNGIYEIGLSKVGQIGISYYDKKRFTDSVVKVSISQVTTAEEAFFGAVCRYTNSENYYLFAITSDGRYSIHKVENDIWSVLVPWTYSPVIPTRSDLELTTACIGKTLSMAVNGTPLAQVNNTSHWRGQIGLTAGTFASEYFTIAFDDLVILTP